MGAAGRQDDAPVHYVERLNRFFGRVGAWSYDHRWLVLATCAVASAATIALASRVRFDNSMEAYFDRSDPTYAAYLRFREDFGSDEIAYILYEAPDHEHGPWNLEIMRKIESLTRALEDEVPFVEEVTSLANAEFMEAIPDGIEVRDLLEEFPRTQEEMLEIRRKVLAKRLYVGGLASADGRYAAIMLEMRKSSIDPLEEIQLDPTGGTGFDNLYPHVAYAKITEILARPEYDGIRFHATGDVVLNAVLNEINARELVLLASICIVIVGFLLWLFLGGVISVVGPLSIVFASMLTALGVVELLGWQIDMMFGMLPVLLITVGVAASVHVISDFRYYFRELGDRREALRRTLYYVGTPCLLTSLTDTAGFGSMVVSPIKSLSRFGVYSAVAVTAVYVFTITLLIAYLSFGRRTRKPEPAGIRPGEAGAGAPLRTPRIDRGLAAVTRFTVRNRRGILVASLLIFVVSMAGVLQLRVDSNFLNEFSDAVPVRGATEYVDDKMGGMANYVFLFDSGRPDGIKDPVALREIERLQIEAEKQGDFVRKTYSVVDVLKDINQTFHDGDPAYYTIPETQELAAQYLLLYEMSGGEEATDYVSHDYSRARLELRMKLTDSSRTAAMASDLEAYLRAEPLTATTVTATGIGALWVRLMDYLTRSQIQGFFLATTTITVMMCLLFRSVKLGLLAMVPNIAAIVLILGGMGWTGVSLDYVRLLIAPIAIGIAVDDAIHHVVRFRDQFERCGSYELALHRSMGEVGRAIFVTSLVLVLGFLVFCFSVMDSQAQFGVLMASTIILSLLADYLLMPALVMTFHSFGPEGATATKNGSLSLDEAA